MATGEVNPQPSLDRLLTTQEVAQLLRIHLVTLYAWVSEGRIPSIKMGRKRLFERRALQRWLERQGNPEENQVLLLGGRED